MSCYNIVCKDRLGRVQNTISLNTGEKLQLTEEQGRDFKTFLAILASAKVNKNSQNPIEILTSFLEQNQDLLNGEYQFPPITSTQRNDFQYIVQRNLQSLGVQIVIDDATRWQYGNSNAVAVNGVIHLKKGSTDITAPVHELSHLIMSVFKLTEFNKFQNFLIKLQDTTTFATILDKVRQMPEYANLSDLDMEEEAFARYIELLAEDKVDYNETVEINDEQESVIDYVSKQLAPVIQMSFGLSSAPNVLNFFKSTIANIPTFGTKLFFPQKMESTGFIRYQEYAENNAKIVSTIQEWVKKKILKKVDCI